MKPANADRSKRFRLMLLLLAALLIAGITSCRPRSTGQRYDLKGKVVSVDKASRTATIAHEDIKDYMPAMTMPFKMKDDWALEVLAPGDQITATLVVDGTSSWLEEPVITEAVAQSDATTAVGPVEPKPGDEVPDFGLINQDGKRIHLAEYRGRTLVLTFVYTRCPLPDQCTLMSTNFHEIDQELQKEPELYAKTHLVSISFDPEYDTPKVLRSYGAAYTGRYQDETFDHWEFATGTKDEVKGIAQFFGLRYYQGNDQIIHSLRTAIVSPEGKLMKLYRGNEWKPTEVLGELRALNSEESSRR